MTTTDRRTHLAEAATDYVLAHGLIGLSLRPLAADLGTSDRMLLYHFRDKDDLVATVLRISNDRSKAAITAMPTSRDVEHAVLDLWGTVSSEHQAACTRLYVEASALGLLGRGPYAAVVAEANDDWLAAVAGHLAASGMSPRPARRAARLVDATFMGLFLDLPLDDPADLRQAVADLAVAVAAL